MSDDFLLPQPPLMSPVRARDLSRLYMGFSQELRRLGLTAEANRAERDSQWWLNYAIALSQIPPGAVDQTD